MPPSADHLLVFQPTLWYNQQWLLKSVHPNHSFRAPHMSCTWSSLPLYPTQIAWASMATIPLATARLPCPSLALSDLPGKSPILARPFSLPNPRMKKPHLLESSGGGSTNTPSPTLHHELMTLLPVSLEKQKPSEENSLRLPTFHPYAPLSSEGVSLPLSNASPPLVHWTPRPLTP